MAWLVAAKSFLKKKPRKEIKLKQEENLKMDRKVILWIIIAILIIAVVYVVFLRGGSTGQVVQTAQSAGQVASQASSGMVGGC